MGEFIICSDDSNNSTLIPNQFIDVYMKDANDAQIKTYLYLVRRMAAGQSASIQQMADAFNHTEKEVVRSLKYWEKRGLIALEREDDGSLASIHLCDLKALSGQKSSAPVPAAPMPSIIIEKTPAVRKAAAAAPVPAEADAARSELFFIVEQYIGKPLSPVEMQKINYIADELHFSDDLIDFLVQYCVGNGKKDFRYIEKVAMNWAQEGITTTGQAKENVARGPQKLRRTRKRNTASSNSFNQFSQNDYDFEALERQILNN